MVADQSPSEIDPTPDTEPPGGADEQDALTEVQRELRRQPSPEPPASPASDRCETLATRRAPWYLDAARPEPPVKLIAIDIDGTLLRSDKRLSKRVIAAVRAAREQGVQVVLASARPPRSCREIYQLLELSTPTINYNGALIDDPLKRKPCFHRPVDAELAAAVVRAARRADRRVVVSLEILDKWYTDFVDESLPTETSRRFEPDFVGPLESFLHVPVTKVQLLAPPTRLERIRGRVTKRFDGLINVMVSDRHLLQIVHPEVDKGVALARVAEQLGVEREHVMAIGDAPNDVGMLGWAGLGLAVENGWEGAQKVADALIPANDEDGVAAALRHYVLR